jgi:hypothetical protein
MSISSSNYAEYAEEVKVDWVVKLRDVLNSTIKDAKKLKKIEIITDEIDNYYFSE